MAKTGPKDDTEKKSIRTTVSIPTDHHVELERIAERKKVSVAWVVREAISKYLAQEAPLFFNK